MDLTYLSSNYVTNTSLTNTLSSYTDTTGLNTLLATKQNTITASSGIFLNGATLSSYTLRWNGSSVPSNPNVIQELHWSNYTMAQTINLGTGKTDLTTGHPTGMATQTWTNT